MTRAIESKPEGMDIHEIVAAVLAAGYESSSETFPNQVASCLSKGFRRVSRGVYAIVEGAVASPVAETPATETPAAPAVEVPADAETVPA